MPMKRYETKRGSSSRNVESEEPKMNIRSILKDIEFLGSSHMTYKQKKDLENRKVVSLGGKSSKETEVSVARVTMKKQKEREKKHLQESAILGRFGAYSSSCGSKKAAQRRQPEDRVLKSTEGNFRNGVLDVKHLLQPSGPRTPAATADGGQGQFGKGKKKKGGKKKGGGGGKRKGGGGKKSH
ncbi:hypothetical protein CASFOL_036652 [Castilleja foliolosa]|uniref:Uncharacterized protein n=1 Tax=Castilleja foliolosa TaxID=1961234 RepID=A0ABD3BQU2_9LAMI